MKSGMYPCSSMMSVSLDINSGRRLSSCSPQLSMISSVVMPEYVRKLFVFKGQ